MDLVPTAARRPRANRGTPATRRRAVRTAAYLLIGLLAVTRLAPEALAFPYSAKLGATTISSERPIDPGRIAQILALSDQRLRASAIYREAPGTRIFLTHGGWRWLVLALRNKDSFAVSLPMSEAIVLNRSDLDKNIVVNGAAIAGSRSVAGVIAHERTHGLIRAQFGILADVRYPLWLREGYCDFVARESSLSDAQAKQLIAAKAKLPALDYYQGRMRVQRELRTASVVALFERFRKF